MVANSRPREKNSAGRTSGWGIHGKCDITGPYLVVHKLQGEGRLAHAATAHHDHLMENQGCLVLVLTRGHDSGLRREGWRWGRETHTFMYRLISQWELANNSHHLRVNIFVQKVRK